MPGYKLTNMVGAIQTRMHRWKSPTRHHSKQMVGEARILPNKPIELQEAAFKLHEKVILQKVKNGELMVTCPDGTTITSIAGGELLYRKPSGQVEIKEAPAVVFAEPETPAPITEVPVKQTPQIEDLKSDVWTSAEATPADTVAEKAGKKDDPKFHSTKKGKR